ncbi:hypothetical protein ACVILJ_006926 [Bradyrhizobium diazoefficiens]
MPTTAPRNSPRPKLPNGVRIYALSDIHGCAHLLEQMFAVIDADMANSRPYRAIEVFLGDYIDRGPDSRHTLDLLIRRSRRRNTVFLKGNHEAYFTSVLEDPSRATEWFQFGGLQTLMSYGVSAAPGLSKDEQSDLVRELTSAMPPEHIAFLRQLRPTFTCGDFSSSSMPECARAFRSPNSANPTCCGSGTNSSRARGVSASMSCTATRRCGRPSCWRTAPTSIPGRTPPEI